MNRKKIFGIMGILLLMSVTAACSANSMAESAGPQQQTEPELTAESNETAVPESIPAATPIEQNEENESRTLVVYFSRWGNTDFPEDADAGSSASIVLDSENNRQGTTQYIAEIISNNLDADLHLIQTTEPYPADYEATVDKNHQDRDDGFIPELQSTVENLEQYDTIFIGYPIWAGTLPPPVAAFLNQNDLSGKTVIPFCTHAGFGSGSSFERIQDLSPDAAVSEGFAVAAEQALTAEAEMLEWLQHLDLASAVPEVVTGLEDITIRAGETIISATLNGSDAAREFASRLPVTVSMTRMGEHEYYGALDQPLTHTNELQTGYTVGDLAFWTPGDLFAIYFDEPENKPEGLMILGQITSDMSVFNTLEVSVTMTIERVPEE